MEIIFLLIICYNIQTNQKKNIFSKTKKYNLSIHYMRKKKIILVPTEEIVINCSYILRILINYGILRGWPAPAGTWRMNPTVEFAVGPSISPSSVGDRAPRQPAPPPQAQK